MAIRTGGPGRALIFNSDLAGIRFGSGLSPVVAAPRSAADMLDLLAGEDLAALRWPVPRWAMVTPSLAALRQAGRERRAANGTAGQAAAEATYMQLRRDAVAARAADVRAYLSRQTATEDGLRERLVMFWADHFTVRSRNSFTDHMVAPYVEEVIRPHVTGRFSDMLKAAETHPMMLAYLDQTDSTGPNSARAARRDRGLNENLAREMLELHTVGVDGPYRQRDVRQLAELLTGLGVNPDTGMVYRPDYAEPGGETVLGVTYSPEADLSTVHAVLDDLAAHPATAMHLARKLAVHFVADDPDPGLVDALARRFAETGGDLFAVATVLVEHPASWTPARQKVKRPAEFVTSSLRALGLTPAAIAAMEEPALRQTVIAPMAAMGQAWERPGGPDGWPEEAEAWVTPQGVAARINWAMRMPGRIMAALPDPRALVPAALGGLAGEAVEFAAGAAEDRAEGVGIVLASAAFQRR
jgi:uncharacterized protein (DUF1800 family)